MEECLVPAHRNQHFQWLGTTTGMPKMRKVQLRVCLQSSKPEKNRSDSNHSEIVGGTLFVPCGDPSKVFQPVDQALDDVALAVCLAVEAGLAALVGFGWDHRDDTAL